MRPRSGDLPCVVAYLDPRHTGWDYVFFSRNCYASRDDFSCYNVCTAMTYLSVVIEISGNLLSPCHTSIRGREIDVSYYNPFSLDTKEFSIAHVRGNIGPRANKVIQQTMTFDDSEDRCDSCGAHAPCMPMDRGHWLLPSAIPPTCVPGGCVHCNYHPGGMAVGKNSHFWARNPKIRHTHPKSQSDPEYPKQ